jgi:DNA-binding NarL/FixJ family response regulator
MIKIIIADDQRLLRESFRNIIENNSDMKVVACATNGKEAYDLCQEHNPDVVLMDISMPVCSGTEATKLIKVKYPTIKVLILTASDDEEDVSEALSNGADGYILKNIGTEELILSIKSASLGFEIIHKDIFKSLSINIKKDKCKTGDKTIKIDDISVTLSDRELKVIEMIVDGKDNKEIGKSLFIAEGTVKNTITEIISKLQVKDRTQLAVFAVKNNFV